VPSSLKKAVRVVVETRLGPGIEKKDIEDRLSKMMRDLKLEDAELSVVLTGDDQIRELNRFYRKKNRPTDVLAFPMEECPPKNTTVVPRLLGDVIVSIPTARKQARTARRPVIDEVTMLLAHGVLHLLGWDHDTKPKERAMVRETNRLCALAQSPQKRRTPAINARKKRAAN
jgi:probable rRNA maturation factor